MGVGFLARPWLTTANRIPQFGRYVQLMRELKDDRQLIFHLHENGTRSSTELA